MYELNFIEKNDHKMNIILKFIFNASQLISTSIDHFFFLPMVIQ